MPKDYNDIGSEILIKKIKNAWPRERFPDDRDLFNRLVNGEEQVCDLLRRDFAYKLSAAVLRSASSAFSFLDFDQLKHWIAPFMVACLEDSTEADVCVERVAEYFKNLTDTVMTKEFSRDQRSLIAEYFTLRSTRPDANCDEIALAARYRALADI
jgi:hypothetical protein